MTCFPVEKRLTMICASLLSFKSCSLCTPTGIGVHFPQAQPGLPVFPIAPCRGFEGFIIRGALYDLKGACHLLRSGEKNRKLTPLSSVAYGATRWPGIKVFA